MVMLINKKTGSEKIITPNHAEQLIKNEFHNPGAVIQKLRDGFGIILKNHYLEV